MSSAARRLEARVDVLIELGVFRNIDLLKRGNYCVRVALELPRSVRLLGVDDPSPRTQQPRSGDADTTSIPVATMPSGPGAPLLNSCIFPILYKAEKRCLRCSARARLAIPFEAGAAREQLGAVEMGVRLELWFGTRDEQQPLHSRTSDGKALPASMSSSAMTAAVATALSKMKCAATKRLIIRGGAWPAACFADSVDFDYFHICTVDTRIQTMLLGYGGQGTAAGATAAAVGSARRGLSHLFRRPHRTRLTSGSDNEPQSTAVVELDQHTPIKTVAPAEAAASGTPSTLPPTSSAAVGSAIAAHAHTPTRAEKSSTPSGRARSLSVSRVASAVASPARAALRRLSSSGVGAGDAHQRYDPSGAAPGENISAARDRQWTLRAQATHAQLAGALLASLRHLLALQRLVNGPDTDRDTPLPGAESAAALSREAASLHSGLNYISGSSGGGDNLLKQRLKQQKQDARISMLASRMADHLASCAAACASAWSGHLCETAFHGGLQSALMARARSHARVQLRVGHIVLVEDRTPRHLDAQHIRGREVVQVARSIWNSDFLSVLPQPRVQAPQPSLRPAEAPLLVEHRYDLGLAYDRPAGAQRWSPDGRDEAILHALDLDLGDSGALLAEAAEGAPKRHHHASSSSSSSLLKDGLARESVDGGTVEQALDVFADSPSASSGAEVAVVAEKRDDDWLKRRANDEAQVGHLPRNLIDGNDVAASSTTTASDNVFHLASPPSVKPPTLPGEFPPEYIRATRNRLVRACGLKGTESRPDLVREQDSGRGHLIVCVHGMAGNQHDLRMLRYKLQRLRPQTSFLMSASNINNTHATFDAMAENLQGELGEALRKHRPRRVSFIAHSLGNIIVRALLARDAAQAMFQNSTDASDSKPALHAFISLAGPHLGALYQKAVVGVGMWFMARWKRSSSLSALALVDGRDGARSGALYSLREGKGLDAFATVILVASPQDSYVPLTSALLLANRSTESDRRNGPIYDEMRTSLLSALKGVRLRRIQVVSPRALQGHGLNTLIGRTAHINLLDSEVFTTKFAHCTVHYLDPHKAGGQQEQQWRQLVQKKVEHSRKTSSPQQVMSAGLGV